jgi:hypothetical protein
VLAQLENLASQSMEEIKILQCVLSLVTTSNDIAGADLAQVTAIVTEPDLHSGGMSAL